MWKKLSTRVVSESYWPVFATDKWADIGHPCKSDVIDILSSELLITFCNIFRLNFFTLNTLLFWGKKVSTNLKKCGFGQNDTVETSFIFPFKNEIVQGTSKLHNTC